MIKGYEEYPGLPTWNVRSLFQFGKLQNLTLEMNRLKINLLGISQVRWPGNDKLTADYGTLYFLGSNDQLEHLNGILVVTH